MLHLLYVYYTPAQYVVQPMKSGFSPVFMIYVNNRVPTVVALGVTQPDKLIMNLLPHRHLPIQTLPQTNAYYTQHRMLPHRTWDHVHMSQPMLAPFEL